MCVLIKIYGINLTFQLVTFDFWPLIAIDIFGAAHFIVSDNIRIFRWWASAFFSFVYVCGENHTIKSSESLNDRADVDQH